jgi:hypothetical protein
VGAYGMVYKCLDREENKPVALKRIKMEVEESGIPLTALREIVFLRKLNTYNHPNIVQLENVVMDNHRLYLVFELLDMDLKRYFDSSKAMLPLSLIQSYSAQLLEGVAHLHSLGIMHRCVHSLTRWFIGWLVAWLTGSMLDVTCWLPVFCSRLSICLSGNVADMIVLWVQGSEATEYSRERERLAEDCGLRPVAGRHADGHHVDHRG